MKWSPRSLLRGVVLVGLVTGTCLHRPEVTAPPPASLSALPPRQAMWSVQGPKGKVVLLGSIHALREKAVLRPEVAEALARAQRVVFESDSSDAAALQQQVMTRGTFSGGLTLSRVVSPATVASLEGVLRPHGMSARQMEQLEPWLVGFLVSATQIAAAGAKPEFGVETQLQAQARATGKQLLWLEQTPAVLASLDALSFSEQEVYLKATLQEPELIPAQLDEMARAWHTGDVARMDALLNGFRTQAPALHDRLLLARNRNWLPGVEQLLSTEGETLVVVGAGHLVGSGSLIELLRARGYAVRAL